MALKIRLLENLSLRNLEIQGISLRDQDLKLSLMKLLHTNFFSPRVSHFPSILSMPSNFEEEVCNLIFIPLCPKTGKS